MSAKTNEENNSSEEILLVDFNNRDVNAFAKVYTLMYRELNLYARSLCRIYNIESEDMVHDAFLDIWKSNKSFNSIKGVKAYLYIIIKNNFLNYVDHSNIVNNHSERVQSDINLSVEVMESEFYSIVDYSLGLLPEKYANVLQLFLDGYSPAEVAKKLDKPIQTIYNTKNEAIKILQKKLPKDKMLVINALTSLLNI